ncbi:PhzF family phenazine biosynthesis protein [Weissella confusa]|uniref:PhzF family phenazine biosynthesis protein n=1 Tax=Weissella fermenti TaxID=2987699 RepID=A0ABT6D4Q7_9LACO|nr:MULTISPECIES: PhzF family phenazine biosynthesis protein [Weissella]MBJ7689475.1 PhzF family phenazine biosynthesis protein [Weissella confusa]MCW0927912.1 PhzF family phenazine biosynthesis protein [Weissella sp. LMG 11983]MDF9300501.1 PhzF family phenazine biosynthesis protein [Weissella sp. BK2]
MQLNYHIVDAFAENVFSGNPAAVFILEDWLQDDVMQKIAIENNLSETAFAVKAGDGYDLRWFTPEREIDLCGHATMATAYILFNFFETSKTTLTFHTKFSGDLIVTKQGQILSMDFPSIMPAPTPILPEYEVAVGAKIKEAYLARDLFFLLDDESTVHQLKPDFSRLSKFELGVGVIVTAPGQNIDFVSRTFFPKLTINEDPVCGSAHSNLIPFWSKRLKKAKMNATQLSARGGQLMCELAGSRVVIGGKAVLYAEATCYL